MGMKVDPSSDVGKRITAALADGSAVETSRVNAEALETAEPVVFTGHTMREAQFQQEVIEFAQSRGFKVAHFRTVRIQRADGSCYYATPAQADGEGWPDLVICKPPKVFIVELKVGKNKLSDLQAAWLDMLADCGLSAGVLRPEDWPAFLENLK